MANDPIAVIPEKCPWCQSERKTVFLCTDLHGNPFQAERDSWNCGSHWNEYGMVIQATSCQHEILNRQLATVTAERDQLRVMAGLLEQVSSPQALILPNGYYVTCERVGQWTTCDTAKTYPTALAAIRAGMGWDREEGE